MPSEQPKSFLFRIVRHIALPQLSRKSPQVTDYTVGLRVTEASSLAEPVRPTAWPEEHRVFVGNLLIGGRFKNRGLDAVLDVLKTNLEIHNRRVGKQDVHLQSR